MTTVPLPHNPSRADSNNAAAPVAAPTAATAKEELAKKLQRVPLELVCPAGDIHEAMAMKDGYIKYGYASYLNDGVRMSARECLRAARRHIDRLLAGEDYAPEDNGAHHAGHARAMLGIYLECMEAGVLIDDRHPRYKKEPYIGKLMDRIAAGEYKRRAA